MKHKNKKFRQIWATFLILALSLSMLSGCGDNPSSNNSSDNTDNAQNYVIRA